MAQRLEAHDPELPPAADLVHMPEPSYLPVILALGATIAALGIVSGLVLVALGVIVAGTAFVLWVRKTREEMAELPLEHH